MPLELLSPLAFRNETPFSLDNLAVNTAAEALVRSAVSSCAPGLLLVNVPDLTRRIDRGMLPPTLRHKLKVVDRNDKVWSAITTYFAPVRESLATLSASDSDLEDIEWDFYQIALAARTSAQVRLDISRNTRSLDTMCAENQLSGEAKARLATIRGTFASLLPRDTLPTLAVHASSHVSFRERVDEILEDAYLLEANELRRFFGFEANRAAVKRALRRLLRAISRERSWARGALKVAEQAAALPVTTTALSALIESMKMDVSAPLVLESTPDAGWLANFQVGKGKYMWNVPRRLTVYAKSEPVPGKVQVHSARTIVQHYVRNYAG